MDKTNIEYVLPEEIEMRSFEIIAAELAERGITLPAEQDMITRRVIHTSADFDYAETMTYSENAVEIAKNLIKNGADIVTDTNMALAGINKKVLASFGGEAHCYMADAEVAAMAKERRTTRAAISMELAAKREKPVIFAVGNAPTALIQIYEMMQESNWRPAFVIGVPVGFVNVEAAKELILQTEVPYIINRGRKGGSNVAAAICNALLYELRKEETIERYTRQPARRSRQRIRNAGEPEYRRDRQLALWAHDIMSAREPTCLHDWRTANLIMIVAKQRQAPKVRIMIVTAGSRHAVRIYHRKLRGSSGEGSRLYAVDRQGEN